MKDLIKQVTEDPKWAADTIMVLRAGRDVMIEKIDKLTRRVEFLKGQNFDLSKVIAELRADGAVGRKSTTASTSSTSRSVRLRKGGDR